MPDEIQHGIKYGGDGGTLVLTTVQPVQGSGIQTGKLGSKDRVGALHWISEYFLSGIHREFRGNMRTIKFLVFLFLSVAIGESRPLKIHSAVTYQAPLVEQPNFYCRAGSCKTEEAWQAYDKEHGARESNSKIWVDGFWVDAQGDDYLPAPLPTVTPSRPPAPPSERKSIPINYNVSVPSSTLNDRMSTSADAWMKVRAENDRQREELNALARQVYQAAMSGIDAYHRAAAVSNAMAQEYQRSLNSLDSYARSQADAANATIVAGNKSTQEFQARLMAEAERLAQMSGANRIDPNYVANSRRLEQDPFSVRRYDYSAGALDLVRKNVASALKSRNLRELAKWAERLSYPEDQSELPVQLKILESFVDNQGLLKLDNVTSLGVGPLNQLKLESPRHSPAGQLVRRVAVEAQLSWVESGGLNYSSDAEKAAFVSAMGMLSVADHTMVDGTVDSQSLAHLKVASGLLQFMNGYSKGLVESVESLAKMAPQLYYVASDLVRGIGNGDTTVGELALKFVASTPQMLSAIKVGVLNGANRLMNGTPAERGEFLGSITLDVVTSIGSLGFGTVAKNGTKVALDMAAKNALREMGETAYTGLVKLPTRFKEAITLRSAKAVDVSVELLRAREGALLSGHANLSRYVERLASSKARYLTDASAVRQVESHYIELASKMRADLGVSLNVEGTRAIPKSANIEGKIIQNSSDNVFKIHPGMKSAEHRMTIGGSDGQGAMYVVEGKSEASRLLAIEEGGITASKNALVESKSFELKNVLDLTDERIRMALGITEEHLRVSSDYLLTNILGDLAERHGYDAIRFTSSKDKAGALIAIFTKQ